MWVELTAEERAETERIQRNKQNRNFWITAAISYLVFALVLSRSDSAFLEQMGDVYRYAVGPMFASLMFSAALWWKSTARKDARLGTTFRCTRCDVSFQAASSATAPCDRCGEPTKPLSHFKWVEPSSDGSR